MLRHWWGHHNYVIMSAMVSQITGVFIVCSTVCSGTDQRKHQSSTSLAFVREIPWWQVDSPRKGPVTWKIFPFDDIIMAKVSQHIYAELYFICPKYLRLRTNAGLEILKIFIITKRATRLLWYDSPLQNLVALLIKMACILTKNW